MALTPGTRLGVYQITAPLGEGGMGQVWRATDTTLGRQVAIKILPDAFAADPDRLARFEREAKTLASLNHPHIAAIYGLEESGGVRALVMELVEGEDLSQRIARGAIPLDEALPIARQIAEALEAAHEQGIIHRDLKPANIKVRPDGTVKVLDFGLAKAMDPAGSSGGQAIQAATITTPAMTQAGVILGTAAYMAPEQAKGRPVDKRADIWAFGAVLYEMLTGRRAFEGEDIADVLSRVLQREPDLAALPASTPPAVRALLARCLTKDPRQRLRDIGDARLDLEPSAADPPAAAALAASTARHARAYLPWGVAALATLAAIALAALAPGRGAADAPMMRVDITTPSILSVDQLTDLAVSPDDQFIAFIAGSQAGQIVVRTLESGDVRPLAGTEGAQQPFWSPDSRSVGFFANDQLKRVELAGGAVTTIVERTGRPYGATWNREGVIVFGAGLAQPLMRVSAAGGTPTPIGGSPPEGLTFHRSPLFLPDGDRFLFTSYDGRRTLEVKMGALSSPAVRSIMPVPGAMVQLMPPDRLVYWRAGELRAQRMDFAEGTQIGEPETLATDVPSDGSQGAFAVSAGGMLAYRADRAPMQLAWFDRGGRMVGTVGGAAEMGTAPWARVSPDGGRVALDRTVQRNRDVWVLDTARGTLVRVTSDPSIDGFPVWSPDGQQLAFESARSGAFNLYVTSASGQGPEERLQESPTNQVPLHWSADGQFLLYEAYVAGGDLFALPMTGSTRTPVPIATTPFAEVSGTFSPDVRWVAYQTDQSGRPEIVVQPFPDASRGAVQVSVRGGYTPRWSADGRELFFMESDGTLMTVDVKAASAGFESSAPRALFRSSALRWFDSFQYDVDKAGRFLMDVGNQAAPPIRLLLNWRPAVAK